MLASEERFELEKLNERLSLVSKEEADACKSGIYQKKLPPEERRLVLQKVGIQCAKKLEMRDSLVEREKRNVDPFNGESPQEYVRF